VLGGLARVDPAAQGRRGLLVATAPPRYAFCMSSASSAPQNSNSTSGDPVRLEQALGLFSVIAIVVGEVIGSSIFFKPQEVARYTEGFVGLILALWIICGLVNLCGALAMAELASMFPHAGGTYVFLRETYGRMWSFMWAWAEFWVIRTGAIAALAAYTATALETILTNPRFKLVDQDFSFVAGQQKPIAVGTIALLAGINIMGTRWGGGLQNVATIIKTGFVAFLAVLPFVAVGSEPFELGALWPARIDQGLVVGIGTALAAIMWAYDGWGNVTVIAEEVRHPERYVPIALISGVLILIALYAGANLAYHLTLPSSEIVKYACPAIPVCEKLLGSSGAKLMQAMLLVSLFGALNVNILVGPRVLFAVARDHQSLRRFSRIHPATRTPAWAIGVMSAWACFLILTSGLSWEPQRPLFDILTEWTVFGGSIFYFSAVVGVFILRRQRPDADRPYRTWGYPLVPLVFLTFYVFLLASMYWAQPRDRMIGLVLIGVGAIAYRFLSSSDPTANARPRDA
jgi:APA family basic amino acid/polyamine antiporter